jgi:hypothetical protein
MLNRKSRSENPERANPIGFSSPPAPGVVTGNHAEPSPNNAPHFEQDDVSPGVRRLEQFGQNMSRLTLALSGTQHTPRSGNLLLRVRDEQPVKRYVGLCINRLVTIPKAPEGATSFHLSPL